MKILKAVVLLAALAGAHPAHALGLPKAPSIPSGGGGATPADVDKFLTDATVADAVVDKAQEDLFAAVASKEAAQMYADAKAAGEKSQNPKEKEAKLAEAKKLRDSELQNANYAEKAEQMKANADENKKKKTADGIYNTAWGLLKDIELVDAGKKFVSGAPSPAIAGKIPDVKAALERLGSQANNLPKVVDGAKKLMSAVGLAALPTSASDGPKATRAD